MLKELQYKHIEISNLSNKKKLLPTYWKKYKKYIKKRYFRKYSAQIWKKYTGFVLLRSYLVDTNLWYGAKKNFLKYKSKKYNLTPLYCSVKISSLINVYNK